MACRPHLGLGLALLLLLVHSSPHLDGSDAVALEEVVPIRETMNETAAVVNSFLHYGAFCGPGPKLLPGCAAPVPPVDHVDAVCMAHDLGWCGCFAQRTHSDGLDAFKPHPFVLSARFVALPGPLYRRLFDVDFRECIVRADKALLEAMDAIAAAGELPDWWDKWTEAKFRAFLTTFRASVARDDKMQGRAQERARLRLEQRKAWYLEKLRREAATAQAPQGASVALLMTDVSSTGDAPLGTATETGTLASGCRQGGSSHTGSEEGSEGSKEGVATPPSASAVAVGATETVTEGGTLLESETGTVTEGNEGMAALAVVEAAEQAEAEAEAADWARSWRFDILRQMAEAHIAQGGSCAASSTWSTSPSAGAAGRDSLLPAHDLGREEKTGVVDAPAAGFAPRGESSPAGGGPTEGPRTTRPWKWMRKAESPRPARPRHPAPGEDWDESTDVSTDLGTRSPDLQRPQQLQAAAPDEVAETKRRSVTTDQPVEQPKGKPVKDLAEDAPAAVSHPCQREHHRLPRSHSPRARMAPQPGATPPPALQARKRDSPADGTGSNCGGRVAPAEVVASSGHAPSDHAPNGEDQPSLHHARVPLRPRRLQRRAGADGPGYAPGVTTSDEEAPGVHAGEGR